jgi:HlyD family secretion protein
MSSPLRPTGGGRTILLLGVAAVVVLVGVFAYQRLRDAPAEYGQRVPVQRGSIAATTIATGNLAAREARLSFATGGVLSEILIKVGDHVAAGQPLARLDSQDLELRVEQAQAQLSIAQIKLQQLTRDAPSSDSTAARATSAGGSQRYEDAVAAAAAADINARLNASRAAVPRDPASAASASSEAGLRAAQDSLAQLLTNQSQVGADAASSSAASLQQQAAYAAEIDLRIAQRALENAAMHAPFDGVVQSISANQSEAIPGGAPVLVLLDPSKVRLDATVDGADVGQVTVGATAQVSLDDHPGQTFSGRVAAVAAGGSSVQGIVSIPIIVSIDTPDVALVPGLAAHATITGMQRDGVLLLPAQAVRREGQDTVVDIAKGNTTQPRIVHIGVSDGASVEILDGVSEGEQVLLPE